ncbi:hypothetical protein DNTS_033907 [Danionella cerebrum]|uniref:Uncharacterized protein n=1 Tax=Danionella cerebrum TaxID=2873325 RepID=A0A553RDM8_9TELE|nr:hypothetical protein DNTS_033907 [Danionella translucida]
MFWRGWHPMTPFGPGYSPPPLVPFPHAGPPMAPPGYMAHPSFIYPPPYYPSYFPNPLPPPIFFNPTQPPFAPLVTPASLMPHENMNLRPACMPKERPPVFVGHANLPVAIKTPLKRSSKKREGSRPSRTQRWLDNILEDIFESVDFSAADGEIVDRLHGYLQKFEGTSDISEILSQPDVPPPATNNIRKRKRSSDNTSAVLDVPPKRSRPGLF